MKQTVLVTGGAGFIGSHLCRALIQKEYSVICIDNLLTGNKRNIQDLAAYKQFMFIEHDIVKPLVHQLGSIDFIYHLASPASPIQYQKHPLETLYVNSIGTDNMLKLAMQKGAKFLFASTSEIYGDPKEHPQKETYWGNVNSFGPRSCYDESKRFGEALVYSYLEKYHVDARLVRIFNTYGPNMERNDGRVISNFITQALANKPMTLYGDGNQTRSFCYVSDLVDGLVRAMEFEKTRGQVVNLGNPDERTIIEIAQLVKRMTNATSVSTYAKKPADDPTRRKPDITLSRMLLHWNPIISLEEGLIKTITYFQSTFSSPNV